MARFRQLDSLRGLAAVAVMMHHFVAARVDSQARTPALPNSFWIAYKALHILILGQESVIFFFVLSGLVLAFAIPKRIPLRYGSYLVHRVCRIYLPYLFALLVSVAACFFFHGMLPPWTEELHTTWTSAPTSRLILQHILFLGPHYEAFNGAFWSLVFEMRISILMPFMVMAMQRIGARTSLTWGALLSVIDAFAQPWIARHLSFQATDWLATLHYSLFFFYGIFIALHGDAIRRRIQAMSVRVRRALLIAACLVAFYGWAALQPVFESILNLDLVIAAGTATIICFAMFDPAVELRLLHKPLLWLGRISYSLYLLHIPIFLSLAALLANRVGYGLILPLGVVLSLGFAELSVRLVEMPAQRLGRRLDGAYANAS